MHRTSIGLHSPTAPLASFTLPSLQLGPPLALALLRPGPAQPRNPGGMAYWTPLEHGFSSLFSTHTLTQNGARLSGLRLRQDATM